MASKKPCCASYLLVGKKHASHCASRKPAKRKSARVDFSDLHKVIKDFERQAEKDRMPRDPRRIPRMLTLIKKAWKKNPNLRLLQLLLNALASQNAYYVEDDMLAQRMKELYFSARGKK